MQAKLVIEGKEFPIEIHDPELQRLIQGKKKTGYEQVKDDEDYYYVGSDAEVYSNYMSYGPIAHTKYEVANYYSDESLAKANARADKLMRQLRRFAVRCRKQELDWENGGESKYYIYYHHLWQKLKVGLVDCVQSLGQIYFDSRHVAETAIEEFKDELLWYFTEYKDSL